MVPFDHSRAAGIEGNRPRERSGNVATAERLPRTVAQASEIKDKASAMTSGTIQAFGKRLKECSAPPALAAPRPLASFLSLPVPGDRSVT
jgi:hypothetical protein